MEDDDTDHNEHTLTYWYSVDSRGNREPVMPGFGPEEEAKELERQKEAMTKNNPVGSPGGGCLPMVLVLVAACVIGAGVGYLAVRCLYESL